ncbi:MAG TPA: hypothetical protein VMB76_11065 [Casimicrobiaceae bacterium]|jgi:hypothetical protein|nr:hypothetical protein [Casimicrobiaceae bacterium]
MTRIATALALTLAACATSPQSPDAPRDVTALALAPYASHEECRPLAPGDRLDYRFTSTAPVAFNIHYSEGNAVVSPITREAVTADSGIYQPLEAHRYCLYWEAGAEAASLDYHLAVRHAP